ncbi:LppU/SCO3897 family protein [Streptomyces graminilatus]|uniref:LppU/SCO3897 family protein n=1 Tax=Streptomyces graminilatus TaxID=1464070 RepID=UPI0006E34ED5|nr:hypothetical protein [Streptomyces graminilatus]
MTTPPPPQSENPYAQPQTTPVAQQPYAPFPNQGAPIAPPPAPAGRGSRKALRFLGAIVVGILVLGVKFGIGWWADRTDAETTSVGACMHNDGSNEKPDLSEVDCTSSDAQFKIVEKFDDTSDGNKCRAVKDAPIAYYQQGGGHNVVLCLKEV